ncbi:MAG: hypothetical protein UR43_C0016G0018 [candidate division TM6 bacterium GW2011_GWF2_33_332]|nr:MAG: hypothetical protein UR43_C0016G0018 [candidate division TM6 bacterium GW2011_GWF2_33_332]
MWLLLFVILFTVAVSLDYCALQDHKPDQKETCQDSSLIIFYPELISAENPEESKMYVVSEEVSERLVWGWWVDFWISLVCVAVMMLIIIRIFKRF